MVFWIFFFFFCQKPDKFLVTIDVGKEDRMELSSVFSTGCASHWEQGKEGATAIMDQRDGGCWPACICWNSFALGRRGCMVLQPDCS